MFETLLSFLQTFFSTADAFAKKGQKRVEATRMVGTELEALADLMAAVLVATDSDGRLLETDLENLDVLRARSWSRWIHILSSSAYSLLSEEDQHEIESMIKIAHAAPGDYVDEIYLIQIAIAERRVPTSVRVRFTQSLARLRDKGIQMKLTA